MQDSLKIITIYNKPLDYPNHFIAREYFVNPEKKVTGNVIAKEKTLSLVRKKIPRNMIRIIRSPEDDINVIETWI
jgi:hypothetical protein